MAPSDSGLRRFGVKVIALGIAKDGSAEFDPVFPGLIRSVNRDSLPCRNLSRLRESDFPEEPERYAIPAIADPDSPEPNRARQRARPRKRDSPGAGVENDRWRIEAPHR